MSETIHATPQATRTHDILADSIAEMTWYEVERAAENGAVLLWAFGVIEQHGPHLPTGTDVYIPSAHLRDVKALLHACGIEALIVPPFYWGVNGVSASFPASYRVRPELMRELMADVLESCASDGFRHVFCFTGHGEALHNRTILDGIRLARERTKIDISFVLDAALATRLGFALDDALLTVQAPEAEAAPPQAPDSAQAAPKYLDIHAGSWETSMMLCACPDLVQQQILPALEPTHFGPEDLAEWREGYDVSRRKTPLGYFGDPAAAHRNDGERSFAAAAQRSADAIERRLAASK